MHVCVCVRARACEHARVPSQFVLASSQQHSLRQPYQTNSSTPTDVARHHSLLLLMMVMQGARTDTPQWNVSSILCVSGESGSRALEVLLQRAHDGVCVCVCVVLSERVSC